MQMKPLLATSALAAVLFGTSAQAVPGSLELGGTYGSEDTGAKRHFFIVNLGAQAEFGVTDGWDGQLDLFGAVSPRGRSSWYGQFHDSIGMQTIGGTLHLNTRVDDFKFGPFLMFEETTVGDRFYNGRGAGLNGYLAVGGETQWFFSPELDLNAQAGGLFRVDAPGNDPNCAALCNAFFINGGATWFFDDDTEIAANFGYVGGHGGRFFHFPKTAQTGYDYGARIEHQFEDYPFSAYLGYDGNSFAWNVFGIPRTQHDNTVSVGVRFFFDGDSLRRQHDTGGFHTPHYERMINQSLSGDDFF